MATNVSNTKIITSAEMYALLQAIVVRLDVIIKHCEHVTNEEESLED